MVGIQDQVLNELRQQVAEIVAVTIDQKRLTVPEAARYLGMSEDTVRQLAREKKIPHYRSGKEGSKNARILFRFQTLDKWLEQQEKANCKGWE
ncbi:helix-turn-helix domain-containing protein [Paenibacillus graminis]|uniref:helix-turn-helix domain-containing protein n=1 Tax=Paenibacillus graminis TaxID=189425 RepID=UPI002DB5E7DC|nr:helix-turn-helix domain-containing protein [Paenibacillus graminis]MEC0171138.1 helix-turn-helix domain-containing protein [Paenibacillus graminis]